MNEVVCALICGNFLLRLFGEVCQYIQHEEPKKLWRFVFAAEMMLNIWCTSVMCVIYLLASASVELSVSQPV